jgi:hypothetical protein
MKRVHLKTTYFWEVFSVGILRYLSEMGTNFSPVLLQRLIAYVADSNTDSPPSIYIGYIWIN